MNATTYRAFSEEMVKIAIIGAIGKGFKSALQAGWKDTGNWMGSGKYTSKLPIGGKSITVGLAAAGVPGALKKEDPTGEGRSRMERGLDLAGNVAGGVVGMGAGRLLGGRLAAAGKLGPKMTGLLGGAGSVVGGIGASLIAPKVLTAPSRMLRERRQAQAIPAIQEQYGDPVSGYGS
jgi:hypothetical protein